MIRQTITSYEDIMTFGKHKGKTVDWIVEYEPGYIVWLVDNGAIECDQEIFEAAYMDDYNNSFAEKDYYDFD